jgi:hypothetical protein
VAAYAVAIFSELNKTIRCVEDPPEYPLTPRMLSITTGLPMIRQLHYTIIVKPGIRHCSILADVKSITHDHLPQVISAGYVLDIPFCPEKGGRDKSKSPGDDSGHYEQFGEGVSVDLFSKPQSRL